MPPNDYRRLSEHPGMEAPEDYIMELPMKGTPEYNQLCIVKRPKFDPSC
jgi:hypothetical protein